MVGQNLELLHPFGRRCIAEETGWQFIPGFDEALRERVQRNIARSGVRVQLTMCAFICEFLPVFLSAVNPHGLRASFFDLNHHPEPRRQSADDAVFKTNKEFLDPDSKSHSTEEDLQEAGNSFGIYYDFKNTISGTTDITQKCILDCAPFTVETLPWDVMAAHYKTGKLRLRTHAHVTALPALCEEAIARSPPASFCLEPV